MVMPPVSAKSSVAFCSGLSMVMSTVSLTSGLSPTTSPSSMASTFTDAPRTATGVLPSTSSTISSCGSAPASSTSMPVERPPMVLPTSTKVRVSESPVLIALTSAMPNALSAVSGRDSEPVLADDALAEDQSAPVTGTKLPATLASSVFCGDPVT